MKPLLPALRKQIVPIIFILFIGLVVIGYCAIVEIASQGGPMDLPLP